MCQIYLIEDDKSLANFTKIALTLKGYHVHSFQNAYHAIASAKLRKPDCFLVDIMLPQLSGGEAVKHINRDSDLKDVPVIFLTGLITHSENVERVGIVIDGRQYKTLGKPYDINQLIQVIEGELHHG